ncbi:DNA polymerase III subunit delta' [Allonocardiopsis opalescens]|uniref:DNA polymerase III delta prime subunit n=1 Tax=Allonocardiopsis opalescens TaxID=1144618 RepID=A0A2T0Q257_9ACTN|nr:DNA polymerase III subunit delta' [Allonocardiopsis opalescens]PRX97885.1 DNA polymerase III delta prime subunit [Allonocardiopsis opalescens]
MTAAGVFADLVDQDAVVADLRAAALAAADQLRGGPGTGMTHAWLFTGPPGSGRSSAARAFAAALQCPDAGCGHCDACHQVLAGTHADVRVVRPAGLSYGVKETRSLVLRASSSPTSGRFQVVLFEDADRATEAAANALLKAVEEPPPRTVWLLCTPAPEDLLVTIRSRCRLVRMRTPSNRAVAELLVRREGVDQRTAAEAARAAQGHIGRARRLAVDDEARTRRLAVLDIPGQVDTLGSAMLAAADLVQAAERDAASTSGELDEAERTALRQAFGEGATGKGVQKAVRGAAGALKELEDRQKSRATRIKRDSLDLALLDLAAFYRDVLAVQFGADVELSADPARVRAVAGASSPETTLRRLDAVMRCRRRIAANVHPQIAAEAMTTALFTG